MTSHGLSTGGRVKLNDNQKLAVMDAARAYATRQGASIPEGMIIDQGGNLNTKHGFAGQPGWLKGLEIGGVAAGSMFIPGVQGALGGMLGSGGGATSAGTAAAGTGTGAAAGTAAAGSGFAAGARNFFNKLDPTNLALGGLSLLGNQGGPQQRNSFNGGADPNQRAAEMFDTLNRLRQAEEAKGPSRLRSPLNPVMSMPPSGGFQMGGGLAGSMAEIDPRLPKRTA